jgi:hypothetical protein
LSKSRHTHQIAQTQRQNAAVRAADELLSSWWASAGGIPVAESGQVEADPTLLWETRVVENEALSKLGARVVRLEMRDAGSAEPQPEARTRPLVAVELVLPDPAATQKGIVGATPALAQGGRP